MDEIYLGFLKEQKNPSGFHAPLHNHSCYELVYYISGEGTFFIENEEYTYGPEHFQLSLLNSFTRNMLKNSPNYYILVFIVSTMITYYYPVYIMTPLIFSYFNHYRQCKQNSNRRNLCTLLC